MTERGAFVPWDVRHVDLEAPPATWAMAADGHGAYAVFWAGAIPLGHEWIDAAALPLSPAQVGEIGARVTAPAVGWWTLGPFFAPNYAASDDFNASRRAPLPLTALASTDRMLERLRRGAATAPVGARRPSLSVVICTRERPEPLARCLAELARSAEPADEVIIVDNAPRTSATRDLVARFTGVRYVEEPEAGLSAARNAGVRAAQGEIIAFTDDDVEVHTAWTARVRDALADGTHSAMTGLVLPASLATESEYLFETKFGGFSQGYRPMVFDAEFRASTERWGTPVWRIGAGANMAFRRDVLRRVGEFDERLGAGRAGCSEDSELWYRILRTGGRCVYDPRAVVFHRHRGSMNALRAQMHAYTRGHAAALLAQFERTGDWGNVRRLALSLPRYYLGRLLGRLTRTAPPSPSTYFAEVAGTLAGVVYYVRHRRDRRTAASASETRDGR